MDEAKINNYVDCLLESWAVHDEGDEREVYCVLHDLLSAWAHYELMTGERRSLVTAICKKLQYHFDTKCILKERKTKTTKEKFPPNPLLKEKEKKEKEEETHTRVCDADWESFRQECLGFLGMYDQQLVTDFYNYWSERDANNRMRWQKQRYWDTKKRLERWVKNQYSSGAIAAAERLEKTRGKQAKEQADTKARQQQAAQRAAANEELERRIEESKAGAVSREEWLAMKARRNED